MPLGLFLFQFANSCHLPAQRSPCIITAGQVFFLATIPEADQLTFVTIRPMARSGINLRTMSLFMLACGAARGWRLNRCIQLKR